MYSLAYIRVKSKMHCCLNTNRSKVCANESSPQKSNAFFPIIASIIIDECRVKALANYHDNSVLNARRYFSFFLFGSTTRRAVDRLNERGMRRIYVSITGPIRQCISRAYIYSARNIFSRGRGEGSKGLRSWPTRAEVATMQRSCDNNQANITSIWHFSKIV